MAIPVEYRSARNRRQRTFFTGSCV